MVRAPHHEWTWKPRWRKKSKAQLAKEPVCEMCLVHGRVTPATVADHVTPHRGDEKLFWEGVLQSLCKHCHDSRKKQDEARGYATDIGLDGYPIDQRHPFNQTRQT
jgi:5-methylcytosine-specific restriction enzyme A